MAVLTGTEPTGTEPTGTDWSAAAFATGAGDRERAKAGVRAAYAAAGLAAPERFVWLPSPAAGAVAAVILTGRAEVLERAGLADQVAAVRAVLPQDSLPTGTVPTNAGAGGSVREAVRTRPWERVRAEAAAELGPQGWARAWAETGAPLWSQVNDLVSRVRQAVRRPLEPADGEAAQETAAELAAGVAVLRGACAEAVLGQHDAPWLALFDSLGRLDGLAGLAEVAGSAGWWWPYERLAVMTERPSELHRDEPGRLHRGDGPALAYDDGFGLHAWRGMPIPADFVASLADLGPARIDREDNAELRRVMLEIFGYDRYLAETGARPVHKDETGVLWRIDLPGDEPVAMVEVVNSTAEPDGTFRTYYLRVPPSIRTAREGVAWTFGVDEADYRPQKET